MAYLEFIKPITVIELIAKIETWKSASEFELHMRAVCMATLSAFQGKVINKRFTDALKIKLAGCDHVTAWQTKSYKQGVSFAYNIEASPQPKSSVHHEHKFTFEVFSNPSDSHRLNWDETSKENNQMVEYRQGLLNQCEYLLQPPGRRFVKELTFDWEKAIDTLKRVNKDADKYDVLKYEFDLSRYK